MQEVYLDYAASTPVDDRVLKVMLPWFTQNYGNPSSLHLKGQIASEAVQKSRQSIAKLLNCFSNEIVFTATGTESVNLALQGVAHALKNRGNHIITQSTEHHAVIHTIKHLESQGFSVTYLKPDKFGAITPEQVVAVITPKTILCSIMYANNEIGTVQPVKDIAQVCKNNNVVFHSDA
ncbi:MAG: aminotransferase class V-fold PLP-dependent enzyme, partial [Candidatus Woesearchaeota archaeon]|nr:aminotransferase class V-fold PLP-dependent enzyme [Candidatus Woesearchaeota archaeon]